MVSTRSRARGHLYAGLDEERRYHQQSQEFNQGYSQDDNNNAFEFDVGHNMDNQANDAHYKPGDHCQRHRTPDDSPKTEQVVSYRRRKPL